MADRAELNPALTPSVLDRLLDEEPDVSREVPKSRSQVVADLKRAIRRDLENLLNTCCRASGFPPELKELENSLVNYGLPDYTGTHLGSAEDPSRLIAVIEEAIRRFEPRLANVRVEPVRNAQALDRTLRFKIEAYLALEQSDERVAFQSALEPTTGAFQVEGGAR
jgi:type VI secretion system protein ImpF